MTTAIEDRNAPITDRSSWDVHFITLAHVIARRGTCPRKQVGAVIARDIPGRKGVIVATGYNGAPRGLPHCDHRDGQGVVAGHCVVAEHAERNALILADGAAMYGATLYSTAHPCLTCARMMVTAGIKRVVYDESYKPDLEVEKLFQGAGIELAQVVAIMDIEHR